MKNFRPIAISFLLLLLLLTCCWTCSDNDDNNRKDPELTGEWLLINSAPDVAPLSGKEEDKIRLEDSLTNYTFFAENSTITFQNDSVRLTADFMGMTLPVVLLYHYDRKVLTIKTPLNLPFAIQGTVELGRDVMEFELTTQSYMSILEFIDPPFRHEILSATVSYDLQKKP